MAFDWNQYRDLALELAAITPIDEAKYRTAASRYYYAAFNVARQLAERNGFPKGKLKGKPVHSELQTHFRQGSYTDGVDIADALRLGCEARGNADYDLNLPMSPNNTYQTALKQAEIVLKLVNKVP